MIHRCIAETFHQGTCGAELELSDESPVFSFLCVNKLTLCFTREMDDDDEGEEEWRAAKLFVAKGPSAALQFASDDLKAQLYAFDAQAMDGPAPHQEEGSSLDPALSRRLQAWRNLGHMTKPEAKKRFLLLLTSILPQWKTWKPPAASPSLSPSSEGLAARILADFSAKTGVSFRSGL
jgi:hypothetical protein